MSQELNGFFEPRAREIVREVLGTNCLKLFSDDFGGHPVWVVDHPTCFDTSLVMPLLRTQLDEIGWQVMTVHLEGETPLPWFAVAPLWIEDVKTIYHVAPSRVVPSILRDGLLPSNEARRLTNFPDTLGKIHGSRVLIDRPGVEDGATRRQADFSKKYGQRFSILEVNLTGLPSGARVYRDIHSAWGMVVDRVKRIDPQRLREVRDEELTTDPAAA
jgi:hypothetical protein